MELKNNLIDGGRIFDFGKTSNEYAKYRDIYPQEFYDKIVGRGLCVQGQNILDVGTGTGVLPQNMYRYGAHWIGTDISENQIRQAKELSKELAIDYYTMPAERNIFPDKSFDVITACQCFTYFNHAQATVEFNRVLKTKGRVLLLYMAWLPFEDTIANASEKLVLKYNPKWSGNGETVHPIAIPDCYFEAFDLVYHEEYPLQVHFTRESWHGRMKSCRGIGASLSDEEIAKWDMEHKELLAEIAPPEFYIAHYGAIAELKKKA